MTKAGSAKAAQLVPQNHLPTFHFLPHIHLLASSDSLQLQFPPSFYEFLIVLRKPGSLKASAESVIVRNGTFHHPTLRSFRAWSTIWKLAWRSIPDFLNLQAPPPQSGSLSQRFLALAKTLQFGYVFSREIFPTAAQ